VLVSTAARRFAESLASGQHATFQLVAAAVAHALGGGGGCEPQELTVACAQAALEATLRPLVELRKRDAGAHISWRLQEEGGGGLQGVYGGKVCLCGSERISRCGNGCVGCRSGWAEAVAEAEAEEAGEGEGEANSTDVYTVELHRLHEAACGQQRYGIAIEGDEKGQAVVSAVVEKLAEATALQPGHRVVAVGGVEVRSAASLAAALERLERDCDAMSAALLGAAFASEWVSVEFTLVKPRKKRARVEPPPPPPHTLPAFWQVKPTSRGARYNVIRCMVLVSCRAVAASFACLVSSASASVGVTALPLEVTPLSPGAPSQTLRVSRRSRWLQRLVTHGKGSLHRVGACGGRRRRSRRTTCCVRHWPRRCGGARRWRPTPRRRSGLARRAVETAASGGRRCRTPSTQRHWRRRTNCASSSKTVGAPACEFQGPF
jgi:hypothetical protein